MPANKLSMSTNINTSVTSCVQEPTAMQKNIAYYYYTALTWINNYLSDAQQKEVFGRNALCDYNKINNFWYLLTYIQMIADQQQIDINNGITNPCSYYADNFTCIIDYFECLNIDITPLLTIFGFSCGSVPPLIKGVGIDEITVTLIVYP